MKYTGKLVILGLLAALLWLPLQTARALDLSDSGPFFGENVTLEAGETFNGDLVVFGGSVTIEEGATVTGSVVLIGGSLSMNGEVRADVVVIGGAVSLGAESHTFGNLVTVGAPVSRAEGARVDGDVVNNPKKPSVTVPEIPKPVAPEPNAIVNGLVKFFWDVVNVFVRSLVFALLAALLVLFLPEQMRRVGEVIPARAIYSGAMGLISILLFITALVALLLFSFLLVTIILTFPTAFILLVIFIAGGLFGWFGLGTEIGLRLATALKIEMPLPLAAGLGTFLLTLVGNGFGLIPCVGWMVPSLLTLVSLGAVFMTRFGTKPLFSMASPVAAESVPPAENV